MSLIILIIIELDDIRHDDYLEESGENISAEVATESFHDPEKLRNFQEWVRVELMKFHRKFVQNGLQKRITRKPQHAGEKIPEHKNFVGFRSRDFFI
jgi:hypothetical protein